MSPERSLLKRIRLALLAGGFAVLVIFGAVLAALPPPLQNSLIWLVVPVVLIMAFLGFLAHKVLSHFVELYTLREGQVGAITASISDGYLLLDHDLKIVHFNEAAEEITGWKKEHVLNKPCYEVFQGLSHEGKCSCSVEHCDVLRCYRTGSHPGDYELIVPLRDGVTKCLHFFPHIHMEGGERRTLLIFRDLTRSREFELLRQDFMDSMSHELRTPITTIKAYVATMRHPKAQFDKESMDSFLEIIDNEANRLSRIIDNILEGAKISKNRLELNTKIVKLAPLLEETLKKITILTPRHIIERNFNAEPMTFADPVQIGYVLNHLLTNAVKFSPDGGRIVINLEDDQKDVVAVSVEDEGIGIPFTQQKKIFETFHKIDVGTTKKIYSVGMGLYIVKKIVEAHGGIIWVESTPGKGSKFTFTLPRAHESPLN
ncbi:MAG: ATP-binding protein [Candidatus Eremiobacteraeota bacterium]|nr:ATP-binding protein [Candidatus Eremiobacteraeota bacterium]